MRGVMKHKALVAAALLVVIAGGLFGTSTEAAEPQPTHGGDGGGGLSHNGRWASVTVPLGCIHGLCRRETSS